MKQQNPLPTFISYKLDPKIGMVISGDHHLTNTNATREYDINETVLFIHWIGLREAEWLLNGDTFDYQGCFFQQAGYWSNHFGHIRQIVVNPGNHDEYLWWLNGLRLSNMTINKQLGYRLEWGDRTIFVTHGHNPWDDFWTNSVVRKGLGKAILSASTHAQQLFGPNIDRIIMDPLIWLEKHVLPRGQRLGKEKYTSAALDILCVNDCLGVIERPVVIFGHTHDPLTIEMSRGDHSNNQAIVLNPSSWTKGWEDSNGQQHSNAFQGCVWLDPECYPMIKFGRVINGMFEETRQV